MTQNTIEYIPQDDNPAPPWNLKHIEHDGKGYSKIVTGDGIDEDNIATIWCTGSNSYNGAKSRADAQLIVSAPDLLNGCLALYGLLQLICSRDDMPKEIKAAILESHRLEKARNAIGKATARP